MWWGQGYTENKLRGKGKKGEDRLGKISIRVCDAKYKRGPIVAKSRTVIFSGIIKEGGQKKEFFSAMGTGKISMRKTENHHDYTELFRREGGGEGTMRKSRKTFLGWINMHQMQTKKKEGFQEGASRALSAGTRSLKMSKKGNKLYATKKKKNKCLCQGGKERRNKRQRKSGRRRHARKIGTKLC